MAGPLTRDDFVRLWKSITDSEYSRPFIEAGEGGGFESWTQFFDQLQRVSKAIDLTTQGLYITPWSGQTAPPAAGASFATVELSLRRSLQSQYTIIYSQGLAIEEVVTLEGDDGGVLTPTGRRYLNDTDLVFPAGVSGPDTESFTAERVGLGYSNPLPGTITLFDQPGAGYNHSGASVIVSGYAAYGDVGNARLQAKNEPDVPIPDHVGCYLLFTAGSNAGNIYRARAYHAPNPGIGSGGQLDLELVGDVIVSVTSGPGFQVGEAVTLSHLSSNKGQGVILYATGNVVVYRLTGGASGDVLTGAISGTVASVTATRTSPSITAESGTAAWQILSWTSDLGFTATNPASPTGGNLAVLDTLGDERGIGRSPGESDDSYRQRVSQIADVVTPNAIRRALNRTLGTGWAMYEVGTTWPGFYFDQTPFDADPTVNALYRRWDLQDELHFRATIYVDITRRQDGDYGFAFDASTQDNCWDAEIASGNFFDGFPVTFANVVLSAWNALDKVRAAGVSVVFQIVEP